MVSRKALANELSGDIASAILAATNRSSRPLSELKEIVLKVHSALQQMAEQEKTTNRSPVKKNSPNEQIRYSAIMRP